MKKRCKNGWWETYNKKKNLRSIGIRWINCEYKCDNMEEKIWMEVLQQNLDTNIESRNKHTQKKKKKKN
jgi:hypothetical protein